MNRDKISGRIDNVHCPFEEQACMQHLIQPDGPGGHTDGFLTPDLFQSTRLASWGSSRVSKAVKLF